MPSRTVALVTAFGDADVVRLSRQELPPPPRGRVRVRVTHASLGSTDVLARRGGYLLRPRPGFVPGYDFVGRLETSNDAAARLGLQEGSRVAGILPGMGAHTSHVTVPASLLVAVPAELSSEVAATLPLDAVTALRATDLLRLGERASVLVQGVTGAVGMLVAHRAADAGARVYGTASDATRHLAQARGVQVFDYRDPEWIAHARAATGGFDGCVDHTGSTAVRQLMAPDGRVVRIAFIGRAGREKADTFIGGVRTMRLSAARPDERLCSIPVYIATRRGAYRAALAEQLDRAATGRLCLPTPRVLPFTDIETAHRIAEHPPVGEKVVLQLASDG